MQHTLCVNVNTSLAVTTLENRATFATNAHCWRRNATFARLTWLNHRCPRFNTRRSGTTCTCVHPSACNMRCINTQHALRPRVTSEHVITKCVNGWMRYDRIQHRTLNADSQRYVRSSWPLASSVPSDAMVFTRWCHALHAQRFVQVFGGGWRNQKTSVFSVRPTPLINMSNATQNDPLPLFRGFSVNLSVKIIEKNGFFASNSL